MDYKLDRNTAAQTQQPSVLSGEDWEVPEEEEELELDPGAKLLYFNASCKYVPS